jgi:fumarate reductase flavoprotein subunit
MELGPRDRLSQAFWHEMQKNRTIDGRYGAVVHLDLRHLGAKVLHERLPQICELAREFMGVDPVTDPIPVRPAVHYTMGGIPVDIHCAAPLARLFAAGECSSEGIHGANRLGSNSLAELSVFGKVAGESATHFARTTPPHDSAALLKLAEAAALPAQQLRAQAGSERVADIRREMAMTMEEGCGIYRLHDSMQATCDKLAELKIRFQQVHIEDKSTVWNSEWLLAIELGYQLDVAEAAHSALHRRESRGAHQRLDGFEERDDVNFLKHSLAHYQGSAAPTMTYGDVKITRSPPRVRAYGAAGEAAELQEKET